MGAGPVAYGQQWTIEAAARSNVLFPAASLYMSDLTVYAFHRHTDGIALRYDVSVDGGQTFPVVRATAVTTTAKDIMQARLSAGPLGQVRVLLLQNDSKAIAYSDTVLTLPTASTWTIVTPPGSVGAPVGLEAAGLNVVVMLQDGGANMKLAYSVDGGTSFTASTGIPAETVVTPGGYNLFASPVPGVWCLINPNSGKIYRSTDSGASWSAVVKTITQGNAGVPATAAIFAVNATRIVACYKGQISVSDDAGLTWTDKQNLTINPPSTTAVNQGAICAFANFGPLNGTDVLGGATEYPHEFTGATTRGAMWRSLDLGTTWTLVSAVGGSNLGGTNYKLTGFVARAGRGVIDMTEGGGPNRHTWFNPNPAALGVIGPDCGATIVAEPCPEPEEA